MYFLNDEEVFLFFRLGLVTGLVDQKALVAWADRTIEQNPNPSDEILELALSGKRPLSEMLWLLSSFVDSPQFDRPLKLLFTAAGLHLEEAEIRSPNIISDLLLVAAETLLPQDSKAQLGILEKYRSAYQQNALSAAELSKKLASFLQPYSAYRTALFSILDNNHPFTLNSNDHTFA